jgi:hypothetical protein
MDVDGEICNLQNFDSSNAAKECAQCRLPSFTTNERLTTDYFSYPRCFRKAGLNPSPQSSPRKRGEADDYIYAESLRSLSTTRIHRVPSI